MTTHYLVPSTPPPMRGRAYSFTQPSYGYPGTPYSGYTSLGTPYTPGVARSANFYVPPSVSGRRSRSHSRPRRSHSHHRSHHGHHSTHHRSHSSTGHRHHRPSAQYSSPRHQTGVTYVRSSNRYSPTLGERILNFFGLGNNRYVDQYGHPNNSRGRPKYK